MLFMAIFHGYVGLPKDKSPFNAIKSHLLMVKPHVLSRRSSSK
jgi:hypothetical protein